MVVFVLNGVGMLGSSSLGEGADSTVARTINYLRDKGKSKLWKVLFTTGGNTFVPDEELDIEERARTSRHELSRGRAHLNNANFGRVL